MRPSHLRYGASIERLKSLAGVLAFKGELYSAYKLKESSSWSVFIKTKGGDTCLYESQGIASELMAWIEVIQFLAQKNFNGDSRPTMLSFSNGCPLCGASIEPAIVERRVGFRCTSKTCKNRTVVWI